MHHLMLLSLLRSGAMALALMLFFLPSSGFAWSWNWWSSAPASAEPRPVIFVGSNWDGTVQVIDTNTHQRLGVINSIPDKHERMMEITLNPVKLFYFTAVRNFIGEGHDQLVDDMYSTNDGRLLVVSRPSFADVVGIDIASGKVDWRFTVDGYRSDHMALSPDGKQVAVSASTGNVVHILNVENGQQICKFPSGDSPHENVYSADGKRIYHASIGYVFTPLDPKFLDKLKGKRVFEVVDASNCQVIKQIDIAAKLEAAGFGDLAPTVRPMAHTHDERFFYFQLSFLHGFVEYDMQEEKFTRLIELPNHVPNMLKEQYVNDSGHHGLAMSGDDSTLCVAGTMDDYYAMVNRSTGNYQLYTNVGEKPYWATTSKDGNYCFISWSGTDAMSIIDYSNGQEVAHIQVGDHPQRIREGFVPESWALAQH